MPFRSSNLHTNKAKEVHISSLSLCINGGRPRKSTAAAASARTSRPKGSAVRVTARGSIFGAFRRPPGCPCASCRAYAAARFLPRRRDRHRILERHRGRDWAREQRRYNERERRRYSEPVRAVRRVGLSRRQTASRASSVVTAAPSLNLGGGFRIDTSSGFFQGLGGNNDVLANKSTRKFYSTEEKRQIYSWILQRNGTSTKMKRGVSAAVAELAKCPRRVVTRIWRQGLKGGGINNVKCMRKVKCGRKKINLDIEALEAIPTTERTTLRQLAENMNMPKTTIFRRLKEKQIRRVTSELKPMLTEENMKERVAYCLQNIEPSTFQDEPTFKAGFNVVHIDEKWFYRIKKKENVYLSHREEAPKRETKNKGHIQKIMFLSAMARPRYDAQGNCVFDEKIGVCAYVDWVQAQKKSANRKKGEWEIKPCMDVDRAKSREYLCNFVLPAIKAKWPAWDRNNTIYIQQDNARTHIQPDDPVFLTEAARGGWDIRMVYQPPNSPDTNILDLGWFASIQSMFAKKMPKTLAEILAKVNQSLAEYPHEKLNRIFLSHQACMRENIRKKGTIHYDVPHMKKKIS